MTAVRGLLSTLLVLCGLALVGVGVPTAWADRHVFETDRWTEAVAPLIDEPEVRSDVAESIATPIAERLDLGPRVDDLVLRLTREAVATEAFADVWAETVRLSHQHAVEGLRSEGTGVNLVDDGVVVDRAALVEALRPRLAEAGLPFADRIPDGEGTIVLADGPEVTRAAEVARLADAVGTSVLVVAPVVLLVGVLVANHRPRAMVVTGLGAAAVAGLLWLVLGLGRDTTGLLSQVEDRRTTALLLWRAISEPLDALVLTTAAVGGAVALLGAAAWLVSGGAGHRRTRRTA